MVVSLIVDSFLLIISTLIAGTKIGDSRNASVL